MANSKTDEKAQAAVAGAGNETAIATLDETAIANTGADMELELSAEYLSELSSEIAAGLKALSIEKLTASRDLIGQNLTLIDSYMHTFNFNDATERFGGLRTVFELQDANGEVYTVAKSPTGSNLKWADICTAARKAQRSMEIPNVSFQERGQKKAGNFPVVLTMSKDSKPIFR